MEGTVLAVGTVPALPLTGGIGLRRNVIDKVLMELKDTLNGLVEEVTIVLHLEVAPGKIPAIYVVEETTGHAKDMHVEVDLHHVVRIGELLGAVELGNSLDFNDMTETYCICTATDNNIGGDAVLEGNLHLVAHLTVGGKDKVVEDIAKVHELDTTVSDCGTKLVLEPGTEGTVAQHVWVVLTDLVGMEVVLGCLAAEVLHEETVDEVNVDGHGKKCRERC